MLVSLIIGFNINKKQDILKLIEPNLVSHNGWLSIDEEKIVNEKGEQVMLRGVNSHHIFSWGYLYDYNNLKTLKETWGVNIFRIAMYTHPEEEGYVKNKYLKDEVKRIVDLCIELDLYVIIDWHILHDNNPRTYEKEAIEFFDIMSKEYADVPNVLYEICNEPSGKDVTWDKVIKPYAENLIATIRKNSPKSIIIVGTANWSKDTESVIKNPLKHDNITYAVHTYLGKDIYTVEDYIKLAIKEKLPIIITECAPTDGSGDGYLYFEQYKKWVAYLEENNLSWMVWQLSDKFESSSLLIPKDKKDFELLEAGIYSKQDLERRKYDLNNYLTETGEVARSLIRKYSLGIDEEE
jgi:endoglucanase